MFAEFMCDIGLPSAFSHAPCGAASPGSASSAWRTPLPSCCTRSVFLLHVDSAGGSVLAAGDPSSPAVTCADRFSGPSSKPCPLCPQQRREVLGFSQTGAFFSI